jgi:hypothetical protein
MNEITLTIGGTLDSRLGSRAAAMKVLSRPHRGGRGAPNLAHTRSCMDGSAPSLRTAGPRPLTERNLGSPYERRVPLRAEPI